MTCLALAPTLQRSNRISITKMEHDLTVRHEFDTLHLKVRLQDADDAEELLAYEQRNKLRLAPWEPWRDPLVFEDISSLRKVLARQRAEAAADRAYAFIARGGGEVVAKVTLSNVVRGTFQACHLGYSVDGACEGKGIAFEAVGAVVRFAFEELRLHRVMANHQPENRRSSNLLSRLGFEVEGFARDYLYINQEWRDHVLTAIINPDRSYAPPS